MQLNIEEAAAVDILNNLILAPARKRKIENSEILYNGDDDDDEVESENDDDGEEDEEEDSYDATTTVDDESLKSVSSAEIQNFVEKSIEKVHSMCSREVMLFLHPRLEQIMSSICSQPINHWSMKSLLRDYFDIKNIDTKEEKDLMLKVEVVLKAAIIYFLTLKDSGNHDDMDSIEELLSVYQKYSIFCDSSMDSAEKEYLLVFRNMMKKALHVINPKRNKLLLVNICSMLEGSGRMYVTGGTQSAATTRRLQIFEHESGEQKRRRPERVVRIRVAGSCKAKQPRDECKQMVTCECGAVILRRTIWKHNQSKKHTDFKARQLAYEQQQQQQQQQLMQQQQLIQQQHSHGMNIIFPPPFMQAYGQGYGQAYQPMQVFCIGSQWHCIPINPFSAPRYY